MKRSLVLVLLVVGIFFVCVGEAAGADIGGYNLTQTYEETLKIEPTIQINDPGSIRVQISWTSPQLTFEPKTRTSDNVRYYALTVPVDVTIKVENKSRPSFDGKFDGRVQIKALSHNNSAIEDSNIKASLEKQNETMTLTAESEGTRKLSFNNLADIYIKDIESGKLILDGMTAEDIKGRLSYGIRFEISKAP